MKTVAVLGASYGGSRAAQLLASSLPNDWRVVMIDRNSHMNHLYVLPRYAVVPGHSHKAFIPYPHILNHASTSPRHLFLHAEVTSVHERYITLSKAFPEYGIQAQEEQEPKLEFDYLVYALGSHLPTPINLWGPVGDEDAEVDSLTSSSPPSLSSTPKQVQEDPSSSSSASLPPPPPSPFSTPSLTPIQRGTKQGGVTWLNRFRERLERAASVLVVGGGALGIQYATDIAEVFPTKHVTLLHSREQLLPRFDEGMHDEILSALSSLNITTILNERLDLSFAGKISETNERVVKTMSGREIRAEVVLLCTGQIPNTALIRDFIPECIVTEGPAKGQVRVKRTMQVGVPVFVPPVTETLTIDSGDFLPGPSSSSLIPALTSFILTSSSSHAPLSSDGSSSSLSSESDISLNEDGDITEIREGLEGSAEDEGNGEENEGSQKGEAEEDVVERVLTLDDLEEDDEDPEEEEEEEEEEGEEDSSTLSDDDSHLYTPHPHIFAIGDAADSFGAINAGHNAYFQADVAAKNILKLIQQRRIVEGGVKLSDNEALSDEDEEGEEVEDVWEMVKYRPGPPAIKVSLGLTKSLFQFNGVVGTKTDVPEDLDAGLLWKFYGVDVDEDGMYA